jgi:hypothetical protein
MFLVPVSIHPAMREIRFDRWFACGLNDAATPSPMNNLLPRVVCFALLGASTFVQAQSPFSSSSEVEKELLDLMTGPSRTKLSGNLVGGDEERAKVYERKRLFASGIHSDSVPDDGRAEIRGD